VHEIVTLTPEERMLLQADKDVEIAGRAAAHPSLPLSGDTQLLAVIDPRRYGEADLAVLALAPFTAAVRALFVDGLAGSAATWAGRDVHEAPEHRLLHLTHLAATVAGRAGRGRGPGLGAVSVAPLACLEARHRDDALATLDRIEEVDLDLHPQVGAPHRASRLATAEVTAKERLEEIADAEVADPARR